MDLTEYYIYPNNFESEPSINIYEREVIGNPYFINENFWKAVLFETGDIIAAKIFFDQSNRLIWKEGVDGIFDSIKLTQQAIYDSVQDDYKYQLWSKGPVIFEDIFLYASPLTDSKNICQAKNYVELGEAISLVDYSTLTYVCNLDFVEY
jgi:hypothetical protein